MKRRPKGWSSICGDRRRGTRARGGVTLMEESISPVHETHFDEGSAAPCVESHPIRASIDIAGLALLSPSAETMMCSLSDDAELDEASQQTLQTPSICRQYDALGAQLYVLEESGETCFVDSK